MATVDRTPFNLGLPQFPTGVSDDLFHQFFLVYQALRNLSNQLADFLGVADFEPINWNQLPLNTTFWQINPGKLYLPQYEPLDFGQAVALILDGGVLKARKASAINNTRPCVGFVSSTNHISGAGNYCEITAGVGLIKGVTGMNPGQRYFLSTTAGLITNVAPTGAGNIVQVVGIALAPNRLFMNINMHWIQL